MKTEKQQTAVEWLESMLVIEILTTRSRKKKIVKNLSFEELSVLLQQAKEMEREQITNAWNDGKYEISGYGDSETYYNETFKSE